jgi:hypothetical protein
MVQVVHQTHEEKMAMYMKLPKYKLAEMLISCNDVLDAFIESERQLIYDYTNISTADSNKD